MPNKEPIDDLSERVSSLEEGHKKLESHLKSQDASIEKVTTLAQETHATVASMSGDVSSIKDVWIGDNSQRGVKDIMIEIREGLQDKKLAQRDKVQDLSSLRSNLVVAGFTGLLAVIGWLLLQMLHLPVR